MAQARTLKATRANELAWDYGDELVPRVGLPSADRMIRRQRWMRRYVHASSILLPFVLLLSAFVILAGAGSTAAPTVTGSASTSSHGRTAATLELETWLSESPSPLPGATILSWDGARSIPAPRVSSNASSPGFATELDTFTLVVGSSSRPTVYSATVEVAISPTGGAVALSGPSILVVPPTSMASGWTAGGPWSGLDSGATVSQPVDNAINGWLTAFTSGNSSSLRLAVGDSANDGHYVPLRGVATATASTVAAATRVAPNGPVTGQSISPSAEIVEVSLSIIWTHEKVPASFAGAGTSGPSTTMDLLVERANTSAPVVVAWGAPGTGPRLRPYQNAVRQ